MAEAGHPVIVVAHERDAALVRDALERVGVAAVQGDGSGDLDGAAALLVSAERVDASLAAAVARQPAWSDLPVLVLADGADLDALERQLGNVLVVPRPVQALALESALRAALRARRLQYAERDRSAAEARAVQERDQFLSVLGHDLRNPIGAITMALQMMGMSDGDPSRYRAIIDRQLARLERLIDQIRDIAHLASGKIRLRKTITDARTAVEAAVEANRSAAAEHQLELTVSLPPAPVDVDADPERLQQIVHHLVANGIKYTRPGGRVEVGLTVDQAAARIHVRDTGIGLEPAALARVFDLFARAAATLESAKAGLGVGLTLAKTLTELQGGTLEGSSAGPDQGCEFVVRLPLAADSSVTSTCSARAPTPRTDR